MLKFVTEIAGLALITIGLALAFTLPVAMIFAGICVVSAVEVHS